jgi:hypothetical protein
MRGPRAQNWDLNLMKNFAFRDRRRFTPRGYQIASMSSSDAAYLVVFPVNCQLLPSISAVHNRTVQLGRVLFVPEETG